MHPSSSRGARFGRNQGDYRDAKARSMVNRFSKIDEDIASKYEYDDDESSEVTRRVRGRNMPDINQTGNKKNVYAQLINRHLSRRDNATLRVTSTGSGKREMIHKIIVKDASRSGKNHVLKLLTESVDSFFPIAPRMNNGNLEFHIVNSEVADSLKSLSRRISDKNNPNLKFPIIVTKDGAPYETLAPETKQLIEDVVKERYNRSSNSIDLSDFGNHKVFTEKKLRCHLFNNAVMVVISNYIGENFNEIKGISLKNNHLRSLDYVASLVFTAPNVIELDLSSNALSRIEELERISGWHIERIHLENNEFTTRFSNANTYTSAIHEYFPRVTYLDGSFVNPDSLRILAETNVSLSELPRYKMGYCNDESSKKLAEAFLAEYIELYDGMEGEQSRKKLLNAYDENAIFTYSIHILPDTMFVHKGDNELYKSYIRSSHNIIHESKWASYREKIVYKGSMDIAVALSKLPLTLHIKDSIVIDFNLISRDIMVFTVQGVFKDGKNAFTLDNSECKFFLRNFTVVPRSDNTMAIISDMLMITPISMNRLGRFNSLLKRAKEIQVEESTAVQASALMSAPPPTPQPGPISLASNYQQQNLTDEERQTQMVKKFSEETGMKMEWAKKCLEDCSWMYQKAADVFNSIRNQIPAEAFN